jgi:hypothetical protein
VFFDKPLDYYRKFSEENLIKIINWCDKNLKKGSYFSEWRDFQHPQLGKVEVGGWKNPFVFTNPPPQFLKQELDGLSQFVIKLFQMGPKIEITKNEITNLGNDLSQVKMELKNSGYLPSYFSEKRKSVLTNIEPYVKLTLSKEQTIIQGKIETKIPHLLGRSRSTMWHNPIWGNGIHNPNELQMKWTIKGKGEIQIVFDFLGAGILKSRITI